MKKKRVGSREGSKGETKRRRGMKQVEVVGSEWEDEEMEGRGRTVTGESSSTQSAS